MNVLVLGGYGLIGSAICRRLAASGHSVTGLGRDTGAAARQMPQVTWKQADISQFVTPETWQPLLDSIKPDAIVNCAGALQDGSRDKLADVQAKSMIALYHAATGNAAAKFVQISAPRAATTANTEFMRTKGEADEALQQSALEWTILRPGLVFSTQAYGSTGLLRALAATPLVLPVAFADRKIQTVHVDEIAGAVASVLAGEIASHQVYDLVEDTPNTLLDILHEMRRWLGMPAAPALHVPQWIIHTLGRIADLLGRLGWRSPLRSTAISELSEGILGDPKPWCEASGKSIRPLQESLQNMPVTVQERWFSRIYFMKPAAIGILSAFWLVTGLITLADPAAAASVLSNSGMHSGLALTFVAGGACADLVLGSAILVRKWMSAAALGMIVLTLIYLVGGTLFAPGLWLDPLGPLVKPIPAMALALVVLALAQDR